MSDIIKLLPDAVANQIAAGEVIQRPSSVVKELVENAIDAGGQHIKVVIKDAGKACVQVIDDGKGMSETDARLAFERHATSKISEAADLFTLRTMGFRGEALASIAAVAQVELRTKMEGKAIGVCINIEGSKVTSQEPVACPVGANFIVRNLFYNVPARRKFLKSNQTEMSNILQEFERIALAHPDIAFTLYTDDNKVLLSLPAGNFRQRIKGIFGDKIDKQLVPLDVETSLATISGYVGIPSSSRKKGLHQFFFVNGRYMRHPYFSKAVLSAYERLIPDGEQVHFFLNFTVDPSRIDVNIHPQKTEIKFQDDQALWQIVLAAVRESLGKFNAIPTIDFDTINRPSIPVFSPDSNFVAPQVHINERFNPFDSNPHSSSPSRKTDSSAPSSASRDDFSRTNTDWQSFYQSALKNTPEEQPETPTLYENLPEEDKIVWEKSSSPCFQFRGQYIVTSTDKGLLLVDQHRAHIRLLYDTYRQQQLGHRAVSQGLLFPQMLQLPPSSATMFETLLPALTNVGFDITSLGGGSYGLQGIPTGMEGLDYVDLLQAITADAVQGKLKAADAIVHFIALSLARRAAIPVGQCLSDDEMSDLLERLLSSSDATYTPDGRRIQVLVTADNLHASFN